MEIILKKSNIVFSDIANSWRSCQKQIHIICWNFTKNDQSLKTPAKKHVRQYLKMRRKYIHWRSELQFAESITRMDTDKKQGIGNGNWNVHNSRPMFNLSLQQQIDS